MLIIEYIKEAELLRLGIQYTQAAGPNAPTTVAEKEKLLGNLKKYDVAIIPSKRVDEGTKTSIWESSDLTYLVEVNAFTSLEEFKEKVLLGFTPDKAGNGFFDKPNNYKFIDNASEELNDYYMAQETVSLA